jgi:acid phosphatase
MIVLDAVNRPLSNLPSRDFSALLTVSFVIPNLRNDLHDGSVAEADQWLQTSMDRYARWAVSHNSLLIVTFDEGPGSQPPATTPIGTIMVGAHVRIGASDLPITHYSILPTVEDMFGLPYNGEESSASRVTGIWD